MTELAPWQEDPLAYRALGAELAFGPQRLFYRSEGSGRALLLLHGFPTSSWDFRLVWPELARTHRLVTFDYLGFGFSDKPPQGAYSIFGYADQAEAVLAELDVDEYDVLAHDLGCTVAQELLARAGARGASENGGRKPRLSSVFFLNGGLFPELHRPRPAQVVLNSRLGFLASRLITKRVFERGFREVFAPDSQPSAAEIDGYWTCISHAQGHRLNHLLIRYMRERKLHRERWVGALLHSPVALGFCNGLEDPVSGRHVVERLRRELPSAPVWELSGVGHYPQTEAPEAVLQAYANFAALRPRAA